MIFDFFDCLFESYHGRAIMEFTATIFAETFSNTMNTKQKRTKFWDLDITSQTDSKSRIEI